MFVDSSTFRAANCMTYTRHLLRSSYREKGKVNHRPLGNLSACLESEVKAFKLALRHKDDLTRLLAQEPPTEPAGIAASESNPDEPFTHGPSVRAVAVFSALAERLGITAALGSDRAGKLALWQFIVRAFDQGSRLSDVRLARDMGAAAVLELPSFDEDDLYENLTWLEDLQARVGQALFTHRHQGGNPPGLFLYDVTSTNLEGQHNALGTFGYNRDDKRGKKQIDSAAPSPSGLSFRQSVSLSSAVVGLLCDDEGEPLAIKALPGNTGAPPHSGHAGRCQQTPQQVARIVAKPLRDPTEEKVKSELAELIGSF